MIIPRYGRIDVKPSLCYAVLKPAEVKSFFERQLGVISTPDGRAEINSLSIAFPAYDQRTEYNAAVFGIQPFLLRFQLPQGWSVNVKRKKRIRNIR